MDIGYQEELKAIIRCLVLSSTKPINIAQLDKDFIQSEGESIPFKKLGFVTLELFLRSIPDTVKIQGTGPHATVVFVPNEKNKHIHDLIQNQKKPIQNQSRRREVRNGSAHQKSNLNRNPFIFEENIHPAPAPINSGRTYSTSNRTITNSNLNTNFMNKRPIDNFPETNISKLANRGGSLQNLKNKSTTEMHSSLNFDHKQQLRKKGDKEKSNHVQNMQDSSQESKQSSGRCKNALMALFQSHLSIDGDIDSSLEELVDRFSESKIKATKESHLLCNGSETTNIIDEAIPRFAATDLVFRLDIPKGSVPFGMKIEQTPMPSYAIIGSIIPIIVSEVDSPFKFWFHLYEEIDELPILMRKLQRFYTSLEENDLLIPLEKLVPGQICAVKYYDIWHRAEIVENKQTRTEVNFFDYGTVSKVQNINIKYLLTEYAKLPRKAIRSSLSHIKPLNSEWAHDAAKYFVSKVDGIILYAKITKTDQKNGIVHVILCDSNGEIPFQINNAMIERGFAVYNGDFLEA